MRGMRENERNATHGAAPTRIVLAGLIAALVMGGLLLMTGAAAAQSGDPIVVPEDQPTIQDAVDAAEPGHTILVQEGTYEESVHIDVDHLKLLSEEELGATIKHVPGSVSGDATVDISAESVTVDGFTIERVANDDRQPEDPHAKALAVRAADAEITNNHLVGLNMSEDGDFQRFDGLMVIDGDENSNDPVTSILLEDNLAEGFHAGIVVKSAYGNLIQGVDLVDNVAQDNAVGFAAYHHDGDFNGVQPEDIVGTGNDFSDNEDASFLLGDGSTIQGYDVADFDTNEITLENLYVKGSSIQDAVDMAVANGTVTVADGTYEESVDIDVVGLTLVADDGAEPVIRFAPENATGTPTVNIQAASVTVDGFTIERVAAHDREPDSPHAQGIAARASNITIQDNVIEGQELPSDRDYERFDGVMIIDNEDAHDLHLEDNLVRGFYAGIVITSAYNNTVDGVHLEANNATENEFGLVAKYHTQDFPGTQPTNITGAENLFIGNALASIHLAAGGTFQGYNVAAFDADEIALEGPLHVDGDEAIIQTHVDVAAPATDVNILEGTYPESLDLRDTTNLTLAGVGHEDVIIQASGHPLAIDASPVDPNTTLELSGFAVAIDAVGVGIHLNGLENAIVSEVVLAGGAAGMVLGENVEFHTIEDNIFSHNALHFDGEDADVSLDQIRNDNEFDPLAVVDDFDRLYGTLARAHFDAEEGSTITAIDSEFHERLTITKDRVTLRASEEQGSNVTFEPAVQPSGLSTLSISAENVTVQDLVIKRLTHDARSIDAPPAAAVSVTQNTATVQDNLLLGDFTAEGLTGVDVDGGQDHVIQRNHADGFHEGYLVDIRDGPSERVRDIQLNHNTATGNAYGLVAVGDEEGEDPLAAYPLDEAEGAERFSDITERGHDALCDDACPESGVESEFGSALSFDGDNDVLTVDSLTGLEVGSSFTVEAWIDIGNVSRIDESRIVSQGNAQEDDGAWSLFVDENGNVTFRGVAEDGSPSSVTAEEAIDPDEDVLRQIVVQHGSGATELYVNGTLEASNSSFQTIRSTEDLVEIGNAKDERPFSGTIDEVTLYDAAISTDLIDGENTTRMNLPSPPLAITGTGNHFTLEEGSFEKAIRLSEDFPIDRIQWDPMVIGAGEQFEDIQEAIENAVPGTELRVLEDTYTEEPHVHWDDLTICSSTSGDACDGAASEAEIISNETGPIVLMESSLSTLQGFTLDHEDDAEGITGVHVEAEDGSAGVTLDANRFENEGIGVLATPYDGDRDQPVINLTVRQSTFQGPTTALDLDRSVNAELSSSTVISADTGVQTDQTLSTEVLDTVFFHSTSIPIISDASEGVTAEQDNHMRLDGLLFRNVDAAIQTLGAHNTTVTNTEVEGADDGIQLDTGADGSQPVNFEANNTDLASALFPLDVSTSTENLTVDATCVHWGAYTPVLIEQRITDQGSNNTIDYDPWTGFDTEDPEASCLTPPDADFELDIEHGENSPEDLITRLDAITFVDESEAGTRDILEWRWDLGDGTRENRSFLDSSQDMEDHVYESVGTFFAVLAVEDVDGMTDQRVMEIEVENIPPEVEDITVPGFAEDDEHEASIHHTQDLIGTDAVTMKAFDPENDEFRLDAFWLDDVGDRKDGLPANATFVTDGDENNTIQNGTHLNGTFSFEPAPTQYGVYDLQFAAEDRFEDITNETFRVEVINDPPEFDSVPDLVATNESYEVNFSVHAFEPDLDELSPADIQFDIEPVDNTSAFPQPLGEVFDVSEHWEDEGVLIDFSWTPENVTGEESYEIELVANGPGRTQNVTIPLEAREDAFPPLLNITQGDEQTPEGQNATLTVEADVHIDAPLDPVEWDASAISFTDGDTGPVVSHDLTVNETDGNIVTWEGTMPENVDHVEVTISADDGINPVEITETIDVLLFPETDVHLPVETSTGLATVQPIHGEPLQLSTDATDDDGTVDNVTAHIDAQSSDANHTLDLDFQGGSLWSLGLAPEDADYQQAFPEPDVYDVVYTTVDDDGLEVLDEQTIVMQQLAPPTVSTTDDEKFYESDGISGAATTLSAISSDPNQRVLEDEDHEWYRIDGPDLAPGEELFVDTGSEITTETPVGLHTYEVRVTDPYGATGTATVDVYVWGFIEAGAVLDNADAQIGPDEYRYTGTSNLLEQINGTVTVLNDVQDGAQSAEVSMEVTYYGSESNGDGVTYGTAFVTTDENGEAEFAFDQQLAGQLDSESIASMPGHHEITLEAEWEDTREHVPNDHPTVPETYDDDHAISFWVGPPGSQDAVEGVAGTLG